MKGKIFRGVLVVPRPGGRYSGGPIWPRFYSQVLARTCWGPIPIPIDQKPVPLEPSGILDAGVWCGPVDLQFGHQVANFGMRLVASAHLTRDLPLVFSVPAAVGFEPPSFFWEILDILRVDRARVTLIRTPTLFKELHVFPQAERLYGGGPSRQYLDLLGKIVGDDLEVPKDFDCVFVSRSHVQRGGLIAGEAYLSQVLASMGIQVFFPERHSVARQLEVYTRAKKLIFSEGSALHALQLRGRLGNEVAVVARRPWRNLAAASIRPRVRSLSYIHAVEGLVRGLGSSKRSQRHRGISLLDDAKLVRGLSRFGLNVGPKWMSQRFRAQQDQDVAAWIENRKRSNPPLGEGEFVNRQLASLGINLRY